MSNKFSHFITRKSILKIEEHFELKGERDAAVQRYAAEGFTVDERQDAQDWWLIAEKEVPE